ncbi:aldehyde dehydrogenase 3, member A2 [Haplosporangium sp. Z 27]|nr:aldehyde dehydrogenase 3, member A2 [Haplosporangium sp. Z 27]
MSVEYTPTNQIAPIVDSVRKSFKTHKTQSLEYRKEQLRELLRLINKFTPQFTEAVKLDLNRPVDFELAGIVGACENYINNLESLTADRKAASEKDSDDCYVRLSPLGTFLIIGTWNIPIASILEPLAGAIAAGNVAVVKPSESSENSNRVLAQFFSEFNPNVARAVIGGIEESTILLQERFDHIFYTGNTEVAKIIMAAASKHLTPVTLELGGKCPVIITEHGDITDAANKIAFWKLVICGQACVTADYVLCPKHLQEELIQKVIGVWKHLHGENIIDSKEYPTIINKRQHQRLQNLLQKAKTQNKIVFGGRADEEKLIVEPTIVTDVSPDDDIMKQEIFGPILPIITSETFDGSLEIVNRFELPLSLYLFSKNKEEIDQYSNLPFGGVGHSGMGNYHGKFSIDTFSHHRAVLVRN